MYTETLGLGCDNNEKRDKSKRQTQTGGKEQLINIFKKKINRLARATINGKVVEQDITVQVK